MDIDDDVQAMGSSDKGNKKRFEVKKVCTVKYEYL